MIALYSDESVDRRVVQGLRRRGVDVLTADDEGMLGASDEDQMRHAVESSRVLLTSDVDHLVLAHHWSEKGKPHGGIVFLHQRALSVGRAIFGIDAMLRAVPDEAFANTVRFVTAP